MKKFLPPLVLFFLAPAVGELLSSSAPPVEFFTPLGLTMLPVLYGGGAVLVRECVIRWKKGWVSLFLLGGAYGIIEEGLMVKSFFDPDWVDLGILGTYGRFGGVNWVWTVQLTIYHAVVSIAVPVVLVEILFPKRRSEAWLTRGWLIVLLILFVADVLFGHFFMTPYRPDAALTLVTLAIAAAMIIAARRWPERKRPAAAGTAASPALFWLIGCIGTLVFFIMFSALPDAAVNPIGTILIAGIWTAGCGYLVVRMSGNGTFWDDRHRLAGAFGILSVFILFSPIREFSEDQPDNPAGMTLVGAAALVLLLLMRRMVKKRHGRQLNRQNSV